MANTGYFKVKVAKHTPLLFGNKYEDAWHKDSVGKNIFVKRTPHDGAYFEAKNGNSILKTDCEIMSKKHKMN